MELDKAHAGLVLLTHQFVGQATCAEGLSDTRGSLEDDVLLVLQQVLKVRKIILGHVDFLKEIFPGILLVGSDVTGALIGLSNEVHQDSVFVLGQLEETAVGILEELHLLKIGILLHGRVGDRSHQGFHLLEPDLLPIILF